MKPPEQIETERLLLRKPRMDDAPAVFSGWAKYPEVTRFLSWRPHENVTQTEGLVKRSIDGWDGETNFRYLLEIKESGELAGMIELRLEKETFKVSFGYTGAYAQWGKGYMTEAVRACIDWAFQQSGVVRVYATTDVDNIPSQRVLEKAGMQREGLLRKESIRPNMDPEPRDCYMYAIVK
ncbi:MAG: GNAT family N-acetyltransferase [Anaerolineales bacterium]|nr:GNAT family N-acetyltransferase [Anaerolineales bacterium]